MSRFLTEKTRKRETEIETKIGEMGHQMFQVIRHTQVYTNAEHSEIIHKSKAW